MDDPATISIAFTAPIFAQILQAIQDLRTEVHENGDRLAALLHAMETRLPVPIETISNARSSHSDEFHHAVPQELSPSVDADGGSDDVHESMPAQPQHSSFPRPVFAPFQGSEIQQPIVANPRSRSGIPSNVSDLGKKRKRTVGPVLDDPGRAAISGFQVRDSAAQVEENKRVALIRSGESSSRSESPFDGVDAEFESTSDGLDFMPPVRTQTSLPPPQGRPQPSHDERPQSTQPMENTLADNEPPNISQHGRIRRPTKKQFGFVDTPTYTEINRGAKQTKKAR